MRDALPLARTLGFELVFDLAHCWWEPHLAELFAAEAGLIGAFQLTDLDFSEPVLNRANLGDGQLPIRDLLRMALRSGYAGSFDLELTGPRIAEEGLQPALARAAAYLDSALTSLGA
jgi:sugar phosphate isomerase/epimerase